MSNNADLWNATLELMSRQLTETTIQLWFGDAELVEFTGDRIMITTTSQVKKNLITNKYYPLLVEIYREIFSYDPHIAILTPAEYQVYLQNRDMEDAVPDNEYTFDHFVVGKSNEFAHATAVAITNAPGMVYNPLLIHGPSGVGKTHLLYAISNKVKKEHPDWKVTYKSTEDFTNEMIDAIKNRQMPQFRNLYRQSHFLLLDDVQFLAGKDSIQEEFFHTFNTLIEAKHQIVLTSDRPPKEIRNIEDRIRNRLEYGLLANIGSPDYELRCAIVHKKSEILGVELPTDVVSFLAEKISANVRQLEGAVNKIMALNKYMNLPISVTTAAAAIDDIYKENPGINPTPAYIIDVVAKFFGVSPSDILGSRRSRDVVIARQCAIYLTRKMTNDSFPEIGAAFGGRDHTTIMHSVNKIENDLKTDETLQANIALLEKSVRQE